jgi:hypothetical protein
MPRTLIDRFPRGGGRRGGRAGGGDVHDPLSAIGREPLAIPL